MPIAALIVSARLSRRAPEARARLLVSAHATWISLALQAGTMALFISGLVRAGAFHPETKEMLTSLPEGVPQSSATPTGSSWSSTWRGCSSWAAR